MTTMVTLLTEGFADWETALLNAVARSYYGVETRYATPDGQPVRSSGGLTVTPDLSMAGIDVEAVDLLVVCGGTAWQSENPPDIGPLLSAFHARGRPIALICDAVLAAARTGLLDRLRHTGNGVGQLDASRYGGAAHYVDTPGTVSDQRVITAPGTAAVQLVSAVLAELGLADENLAYYLDLHRRQFAA